MAANRVRLSRSGHYFGAFPRGQLPLVVSAAWAARFLPEGLRRQGLGSRVLKTAEEEGARRGCTRAILSTLSFQAPGFYERQGWQVLGRIDCDPPGHTRFSMTKRLVPHRGWIASS